MKYYSNGNILQAIHIEKEFIQTRLLFKEELNRNLDFNKDVVVLSDCNKNSILYAQCKFNNIKFVELNKNDVVNQLNSITEKYVLYVKGDAMLLEDFKDINEEFIIAGQNTPNSKYYPMNKHNEWLLVGNNKFINPNMIFARRTRLIEFFENYRDYCKSTLGVNVGSLKEEVELNVFNLWFSTTNDYKIDSEEKYFSSITQNNYKLIELDNARYLKIDNMYEIKFRLF